MKNQSTRHRIDTWRGLRSALALSLSLVLAASSLPAAAIEAAPDPGTSAARFYRNGDQLFRLDYVEVSGTGATLPADGGEVAFALSRAVFPSSLSEREWRTHGFTFEEQPGSEAIVDLGNDPYGPVRDAVRLDAPARWEEVVTWTVSATGETVTSTFRVGVDWVSLTLPRELLEADKSEPPADAVITVEANGIAARLDPALIEEVISARTCGDARPAGEESRALREIADSFVDLPRFLNHVRGYLEIERKARIGQALNLLPRDGQPAPSSCTPSCLSCAGVLLASVGAYIALVSTCGGALVTGGASAVLCIASFIGVQSSHLIVFASCARCIECVGQPACPCAGQPLCDCG